MKNQGVKLTYAASDDYFFPNIALCIKRSRFRKYREVW